MAGLSERATAGGAGIPAPAVPIVALDFPTAREAVALADRLGALCRFYKVGGELFTAEGPSVVRALGARGCDVFLDLKFHDIPSTVRGSARSAAALGARLLTVHGSGGGVMIEAAVEGAGDGCGVLAVTVLTSFDGRALATAWGRPTVSVEEEVLRLSDEARRAGAHGVVCSGQEVGAVHARHGALRLLVPGLRLGDDGPHDQARVTTPAAAARAGASYLVLGRAVSAAADPCVAMSSVLRSLAPAG